MNIIETPQKGKRLVTTVHQSRLPLCLPILKSNKQATGVRKIETNWGSIEIDGIFTQRHRDVLDAIMAVSKRRVVVDGAMRILFDPREVLTFIGSTTGKAWLKQTIKEMQKIGSETVIHGKLNGKSVVWEINAGLIRDLSVAKTLAPRRTGTCTLIDGADARDETYMWVVNLSQGLTRLFEEDMGMLMSKQTASMICRLKTGEGKALARFLLSHQRAHHIGWASAAAAIGVVPPSDSADAKGKRRIRMAVVAIKTDETGLSALGIAIDSDGAHYLRASEISFLTPKARKQLR